MFELKVAPFQRRSEHSIPANPAYLDNYRGFRIGVYVEITPAQRCVAMAAVAFAAAYILLLSYIGPDDSTPLALLALAATYFLIIAALLMIFSLRTAVGNIYLTQPGAPSPRIDRLNLGEPNSLPTGLRRALGVKKIAGDQFEFHIDVRLTEPTVAKRLEKYADSKNSKTQKIRYPDDQALIDSLTVNRAFHRRTTALHRYYLDHHDLWPVVRMMVWRILYAPSTTHTHPRAATETGSIVVRKRAQLYLTLKVHTLPLAYWFLMNSFAVSIAAYAGDGLGKGKILLALLPIIWAIWSIRFHGKAAERWEKWLAACGRRPLGGLPINLFVDHDERRQPQWEELDERDFTGEIDAYLSDSANLTNIIVTIFAAGSLTIFSLM